MAGEEACGRESSPKPWMGKLYQQARTTKTKIKKKMRKKLKRRQEGQPATPLRQARATKPKLKTKKQVGGRRGRWEVIIYKTLDGKIVSASAHNQNQNKK